MVEKLVLRIMEKAKAENDHDYGISKAKVLYDLRQEEDFTEDVHKALNEASEFLHKLIFYPKTQKLFFAEKFETKSIADYEELFEKELKEKNGR